MRTIKGRASARRGGDNKMKDLVEYFNALQPGKIQGNEHLEKLVWDCWHEFKGSDETKMDGYKILHRMEKAFWNPPIFSFTIERHGATVGNSVWADIQRWALNLASKEAHCETMDRRMVSKMDSRLDVNSIAQEVADLILKHSIDDRLKWNRSGTVRVQVGKIIPETKKETTAGRRKKFRKALTEIIGEFGWQEVRPNVYHKT